MLLFDTSYVQIRSVLSEIILVIGCISPLFLWHRVPTPALVGIQLATGLRYVGMCVMFSCIGQFMQDFVQTLSCNLKNSFPYV